MKNRFIVLISILVMAALLAACGAPAEPAAPPEGEAETETPAEAAAPTAASDANQYGQVTDVGGIDDKGFNQLAWNGMQRAAENFGVNVQFLESQQQTDYEKNINEFIGQGYSGIVTVGFLLADATRQASEANPDFPFAIVDYPSETDGILGLLFAVDEPSFLAGYLAAGMTQTGIVCTYGGVKIPPVVQFLVGYEAGVNYYNEQKGTDVRVLGWATDPNVEGGGEGAFTGNFESLDDGRAFAENFFDEGCDIIFPVAGPVGLGSATAAQERGFQVIGVDADLTETNPDAAEVYLTSVLKKIDVAVYEAISQIETDTFAGGTNLISNLENGGVGLAPFYDYDDDVPQEMKDELAAIEAGIIAGEISTGWPVGGEEAPAEEPAEEEGAAEPAEEEAAAESDVSLVMSFVPSGDSEEILTSGEEIAIMIEDRTGYEVEANVATSYAAVIEAMGAGNADIGWLNTFGYILAHERHGVEVALVINRFGSATYQGQIITLEGSGIETITDLAGVTFCRPDPVSTSGWIVPRITMAAAGIDPDTDMEVIDVGSHNSVVTAVYNGECEAGATFVDARSSVEEDIPDVKDQVLVIRESAPIPNDGVSFATQVPEDVRENVVAALLDIAATEEGAAALESLYEIGGLEVVDDTFYDTFRVDLDASGYSIEDFQAE